MRPSIEQTEMQNWRLDPTGSAKPGETSRLMGTSQGLDRPEAAGRVFGLFWNRTEPLIRSEPGPLARYPDPLLTLVTLTVLSSPRSMNIGRHSFLNYLIERRLLDIS
jgi:hypothetical protein